MTRFRNLLGEDQALARRGGGDKALARREGHAGIFFIFLNFMVAVFA
jgi:hypothetical protein